MGPVEQQESTLPLVVGYSVLVDHSVLVVLLHQVLAERLVHVHLRVARLVVLQAQQGS